MYVVTGGGGFIGSNLVKALNAQGCHELLLVDDWRDGRKLLNIADLSFVDALTIGEFRSLYLSRDRYLDGVEAIFHMGAISSTQEWDGVLLSEYNWRPSIELIDYALASSIKLVYASSAAVYGRGSANFTEDPTSEAPVNAYAVSKLIVDNYIRRRSALESSQVVGLRFFNVYGPREFHKGPMASPVAKFTDQLRRVGKATVFEEDAGMTFSRDFVYVDDAVAAATWFLRPGITGGVFNVGTGKATSFREVAQSLASRMDGTVEEVPFPGHLRASYQPYTCADLTLLRSTGCDVTFRSVPDGIDSYIRELEAHPAWASMSLDVGLAE